MDKKAISDENTKIVIYPSIRKVIKMIILSLLLTGIGFFEIIYGVSKENNNGIFATVIGFIGVAFFGLCFIYLIYRLFVKKPILVIDENGIIDNASASGVGLIKWSEIKEVIIYTYVNQKFLGIIPNNTDIIKERLNGFKKIIFNINRKKAMLISAPINIPQSVTKIKLEDIKEEIDILLKTNVK
ncbi:STM3941 family protein [Vallitalea maricola]|uniref:Uncharacterized protein n=1 Tax=Vallitalea maricola TaxID=3074433 RepID=A0ACB5UP63_9FIRM|nr:hypothetical protein AN2V17_38900 [Vallitalea sp. AN17-2]